MLKMVDGTGIIGLDMICPLGVSTPQPPNYDRVEMEGAGMLVLPNSLDAPLERLELGGKTEQVQTTGKNLANPSEFVVGTLAGDTGNIINLKQYITTGYIPVIPGKRYSTSCGNEFSAHTITAYDKEKTKINYPMNMSSEMPEGAAYIRLSYKKIDMTNVTESDMEELKKVCMVNEGSTVLPCESYTGGKPSPSPEYPQEIKSVGKWNESTQKYEIEVVLSGKNLLDITACEDGKTLDANGNIVNNANALLSDFIPCFSKTSYCRVEGHFTAVSFYDVEKNKIGFINQYDPCFATPDKCRYFRFSLNKTKADYEKAVANVGTALMDYEPYKKPQTLTITSDRPITKWDRLVEQSGQIGWLYASKKYVITGNEIFEYRSGYDQDAYTNRFIVINDLFVDRLNDKQLAYCKILKRVQYIYAQNKLEEGIDTNVNQLHIKLSNDRIGVLSSDDTGTRTTKIIEYIKNTYTDGIEIMYMSNNSVFIPLPQSEQNAIRALKTYYPTTVITADGGELDPDIKVTYRKEI